jgi:hypothetical protein
VVATFAEGNDVVLGQFALTPFMTIDTPMGIRFFHLSPLSGREVIDSGLVLLCMIPLESGTGFVRILPLPSQSPDADFARIVICPLLGVGAFFRRILSVPLARIGRQAEVTLMASCPIMP